MSFVDELNYEVSREELKKEEDKIIEKYTSDILLTIKASCMGKKRDHKLAGFYCVEPWEGDTYIDDNIKERHLFSGLIGYDYNNGAPVEISEEKFKNSLTKGVQELGFENYTINLTPFWKTEKIINGKTFLGNTKYKKYKYTAYAVYISLKW